MIEAPHPWRRLAREWPGVPVLRRAMPSPYLHAQTRWRAGHPIAVIINRDLTQVQARCAVAHECEHLLRGAPCDQLAGWIEQRVIGATSRYLLPDLGAVRHALQAGDSSQAAEQLWVTHAVLLDRLRALTDQERAQLQQWSA